MPILVNPCLIRETLRFTGGTGPPLFCPNAETPDEIEGVLEGAARHIASHGLSGITIGIGITGGYPDHPQLKYLSSTSGDGCREESARKWLQWLDAAVFAKRYENISVIPFFDHGWVPDIEDLKLMRTKWFQRAMGIVLFDASKYSIEENLRLTAEYVQEAGGEVVIEGCPDKVYEKAEVETLGLTAGQLLSDPATVERFVAETHVDLVVPNLGTEHRSSLGRQINYASTVALELRDRIGPRLALHGTSSLGGRLAGVHADGICKINFYTAMAREASEAVRQVWNQNNMALGIQEACGSFIFRHRRETIAKTIEQALAILQSGVAHS